MNHTLGGSTESSALFLSYCRLHIIQCKWSYQAVESTRMWTVGGQDFPPLIRQSFPTVYNGTQHVISAHYIFVANSIDNRLTYPNLLRSKL